MRVVICWGGVSGYMAACWRELAQRPGVELLVFNFAGQLNTAFDDKLLDGIPHKLLPVDAPDSAALIRQMILDHRADVVSVSGWLYPAYRALAADPALANMPFVMGMDTPLQRTWRQRLARVKIGRYLDRMSRVIVPGERAFQYARYLGVPERKIRRGLYGIDYRALEPLHAQRLREADGAWPKRFLFTGRYHPDKAVDVLMEAYRRYRGAVTEAWPLTCCGMGPLEAQVSREPGVENRGFVQPAEMAKVMAGSGVFVLPSRYDPWPLAIVEACAAGMPVLCTEACGSAVELVRTQHSGLIVATEDVAALADGLMWMHEHHAALAEMGRRAQGFAAAYSAQAWADRWEQILREVRK